jgi:MFS transporter, DHA1 family, inner membrane transport protein
MKKEKLALGMFSILVLSYVINAMDRQLFPVLAPEVRSALGLSLPQVGLAATLFTLGMGLAGIPTGFLLGVLSRRAGVILGLIIFSAATYVTAYAQGIWDLLLYRFVSGLGEAVQLTALLAIATTYFANHRALAASALNFGFGIGAVIGPNLGAAILSGTRWQVPFIVFGLLGAVVLMLILLFVKPWLCEATVQEAAVVRESPAGDTIWATAPLTLSAATVFAGLAIYGYLGLYPTYLREALGFTPREAGLAVSFYGFGALMSPAGGWLGDRYDYHKLLFASFLASAVTGAVLFSGLGRSLSVHIMLSFIFGVAMSAMVYVNLAASFAKSVKREHASFASGLFVASLYIPAAFSGYLLGSLKESFGWSTAGIIQIAGSALMAAILVIIGSRPPAPHQ